jgi:hypothetical protein
MDRFAVIGEKKRGVNCPGGKLNAPDYTTRDVG